MAGLSDAQLTQLCRDDLAGLVPKASEVVDWVKRVATGHAFAVYDRAWQGMFVLRASPAPGSPVPSTPAPHAWDSPPRGGAGASDDEDDHAVSTITRGARGVQLEKALDAVAHEPAFVHCLRPWSMRTFKGRRAYVPGSEPQQDLYETPSWAVESGALRRHRAPPCLLPRRRTLGIRRLVGVRVPVTTRDDHTVSTITRGARGVQLEKALDAVAHEPAFVHCLRPWSMRTFKGRRAYVPGSEPQQDLYETPAWAVEKMLAHGPDIPSNYVIWEPSRCHGNGRITSVLKAAGFTAVATDLFTLPEKTDFLTCEPPVAGTL